MGRMVRKAEQGRLPMSQAGPAEIAGPEDGFTLLEVICVVAIISIVVAIILSVALALLAGITSALWRYSFVDNLISTLSFIGLAMPVVIGAGRSGFDRRKCPRSSSSMSGFCPLNCALACS